MHAQWLIRVQEIIRHEKDLIVQGFTKTGIAKAVWDGRKEPVPAFEDSDAETGDWDN